MFYGLQNAGDSCQEGYACAGVSQMREPPARCGRLDRTVYYRPTMNGVAQKVEDALFISHTE